MKPEKSSIPEEDMNKVIWSYLSASSAIYHSEPMVDPIKAFPTIRIECSVIKSHMMNQLIKEEGSGRRLDRIKNDKQRLSAIHMRKLWIIEKWVSFEPIENEITQDHLNVIGLAYLTDETASAVIEYAYPELGDFSTKQFQDFRKEYQLIQVPLPYRQSGVLIKGVLKITRKGRKQV